jgi:hypothetical protein
MPRNSGCSPKLQAQACRVVLSKRMRICSAPAAAPARKVFNAGEFVTVLLPGFTAGTPREGA